MDFKVIKFPVGPKKNLRNYKALLFVLEAPLCLCNSLGARDCWTILFISCLALYAPICWASLVMFLCYKVYSQFLQNNIMAKEIVQCDVVLSVELNKLQKLSDAIDANPDVLYCDYQRRSLIAWCRYYKNTQAQELIITMMKKYPKEAIAA
ncbi:MAG: hypothetical protein Q7U04_09630 [Bacteriovorax sp.]|nr:hypothetical protein [Bacteriovorax sp.]